MSDFFHSSRSKVLSGSFSLTEPALAASGVCNLFSCCEMFYSLCPVLKYRWILVAESKSRPIYLHIKYMPGLLVSSCPLLAIKHLKWRSFVVMYFFSERSTRSLWNCKSGMVSHPQTPPPLLPDPTNASSFREVLGI